MKRLKKNSVGPIVIGSALHRLLTLIAGRIASVAAEERGASIASRQGDKPYLPDDSLTRAEDITSKMDAPVDKLLEPIRIPNQRTTSIRSTG
jgi:hypothetical protein